MIPNTTTKAAAAAAAAVVVVVFPTVTDEEALGLILYIYIRGLLEKYPTVFFYANT